MPEQFKDINQQSKPKGTRQPQKIDSVTQQEKLDAQNSVMKSENDSILQHRNEYELKPITQSNW